MTEERARNDHPFWSYRLGLLPTPGQRYLNWRHKRCRRHVRGRDVLDVPSGEGLGLRYLSNARSITCLDYDAKAVETAGKQVANVKETVCASMTSMPMADACFDTVVSLEGLEHVDKHDGVRFLSEVWRVLRPGGELLLSCPVSVDGRHSGNAFHFHEWRADDLRRVLDIGFDVLEFTEEKAFNSVIWCRARKQERKASDGNWETAFSTLCDADVRSAMSRFECWLSGHLTEVGAPLHATGGRSLMPTCFAILAAESIGALNRHSAIRPQLAEYIQSHQDSASGLFSPGEICRKDLTSHSATYLRLQATYFALHALDALGASPRNGIEFANELCDQSYLRGWLDGGPWKNPWMHSNNIMFALTLLERRARLESDPSAMDAFDAVLEYLDRRQDPESGLWQPDDERDVRNAVYAAYHFFPYYFWRGHPIRHVDRIIDSTLSIQRPDGLFTQGGGACEDLDGVHTLVLMSEVSDYRADDVQRSLERCFWRLLQIQNSDDGFWNYPERRGKQSWKRRLAERMFGGRALPTRFSERLASKPVDWCYSGWKRLSCPTGASDMWAAWFRPLALKLISDRYSGVLPLIEGGRYRRIPGLGWHDSTRIEETSPRSNGKGNKGNGLGTPIASGAS